MRLLFAVITAAALALVPSLASDAMAQDAEAGDAPTMATPAASSPNSDAGDGDSADAEAELQATWGEKRVIRTLQRRLFTKFGRAEFSFFLGIVPNDPFVLYLPIGLRVNYHFNEAFAVELATSYLGCFTGDIGEGDQARGIEQGCLRVASSLKNDLAVEKAARTQIDTIRLLDQQVMRADIVAMWSPFFGKVAVMNDSLVHFDVNLVGGAGFLLTEKVQTDGAFEVVYRPTFEAVLGAGLKFYFGERFGIRADFRQFIFPKDPDETGGTANPSEISLGFSVFTD